MLKLPKRLHVRLMTPAGEPLAVADVLVVTSFFLNGRYYYGGAIAMTDDNGIATLSRSDVQADFAQNQQLFPMDYRIPLTDCDADIEISLMGGSDFLRARDSALSSPILQSKFAEMWRRARNQNLAAAQVRIRSVDGSETVVVDLRTVTES